MVVTAKLVLWPTTAVVDAPLVMAGGCCTVTEIGTDPDSNVAVEVETPTTVLEW